MSELLPRIGVGVLVWRGNRLLLGRRLHGRGAGSWQLPGGWLEPQEDVLACARREVAEETGLVITDLRPGTWTEDRVSELDLHYLTVFVYARYVGGEPRAPEPLKSAQWDWFSTVSLPEPLFAPLQRLMQISPQPLRPASAGRSDYGP